EAGRRPPGRSSGGIRMIFGCVRRLLAGAGGRRCALAVVLAVVGSLLVGAAPAAAARFVYVANFSIGQLSQFNAPLSSFEALEPLSPATVATGGGPHAVAVIPDGNSAYVANSGGSTVSQYSLDPSTGVLSAKSPATVATGSGPTAMAVTPNGKSAYVVNLDDNTVSQYSIDPTTGLLSAKSPASVATGSFPNSVALTPDGKSAYVVNEGGN